MSTGQSADTEIEQAFWGSQSPCWDCQANCCSDNLINLCGYDIWRIAARLQLEPTAFLAFAEVETPSPYDFRLDATGKAYCATLNMKPDEADVRRCIFLMDLPQHQTRCGIYSFRPAACTAYPLVLNRGVVEVKPWALCADRAELEWPIEQVYSREELESHDMEFCIYAFAVANWGRMMIDQPERPLDFRPFLTFILDVYGRIEPLRALAARHEWVPIWHRWQEHIVEGLNPLSAQGTDAEGETAWSWWLQAIRRAVFESLRETFIRGQDISNPRIREAVA